MRLEPNLALLGLHPDELSMCVFWSWQRIKPITDLFWSRFNLTVESFKNNLSLKKKFNWKVLKAEFSIKLQNQSSFDSLAKIMVSIFLFCWRILCKKSFSPKTLVQSQTKIFHKHCSWLFNMTKTMTLATACFF